MRRKSLACIDIRDEYIRQLLSPINEQLGLDEPIDGEEYLTLWQYNSQQDARYYTSYTKSNRTHEEDPE